MGEYIKREEILQRKRIMSGVKFGNEFCDYAVLREDIERIPTADVAEVRHGYWQPNYETFLDYSECESAPIQTGWVCSLCGRYEPCEEAYCHCGAKMDGKGE